MTIKCEVTSVTQLTPNTYRILLKPEQQVQFKAGQYLLAVMGENDKRPFSIANSPKKEKGSELELHIGAAEANPYAAQVVQKAQDALADPGISFDIDAPHGEAWLQDIKPTPRLLIAGGTGFSYVRSILEDLLLENVSAPIFVYWGGRSMDQLYDDAQLMGWAAQFPNLTYVPVVENADDTWQGKTGNVLEAVMADFVSLSAYDIYIAGRFDMAGAARELFCQERGAQRDRLFGDAYSFI